MPNYQRKTLETGANIGEPGPLPENLVGFADTTLADLSADLSSAFCEAEGYVGQGFFPVADPEPEPEPSPRWIHKALFKRRFTQPERIAIRLAETNEAIDLEVRLALIDFREILDATDNVFLDDMDLIAGLGLLVSLGLISELRPAQIRE